MRTAFINELITLARDDKRIWLLVGDLGYSTFESFISEFPERFVNVGVAEQNMIGVATGLALSGNTVFVYSIANFPTLRCLEQIRNDVCYHNANVKIIASGCGFTYGALGMTHHATEDLAIMRALPNLTIVAPGDPVETTLAIQAATKKEGPFYLRLGRSGEPIVHRCIPNFQVGKAIRLLDGDDIALISTGGMLFNTMQAAELLAHKGIKASVLSMHTVKPIDVQIIQEYAKKTKAIMTIEEHSIIGGLGGAVAETLAELDNHIRFQRLGIKDIICERFGSQEYLRELNSLSVAAIAEKSMKLININT